MPRIHARVSGLAHAAPHTFGQDLLGPHSILELDPLSKTQHRHFNLVMTIDNSSLEP